MTVDERLAMFPARGLPVEGRAVIHWDDRQIPFIDAETDGDAAFALGLVHAHLRLGQMAVYKRIARGRIAEMGGPLATDIDHGLRVLAFGRAAAEIEAGLPPATRRWLQRFVDGINHYQAVTPKLPVEYSILGLDREPWTIADIVAFGRLAGTDVTWLVWFNLLKLREREDWPEIWGRLVRNGSDSVPSIAGRASDLGGLLAALGRSGSNSVAIAAGRSRTGGAIMANDPHLGINLPNSWLLVGLRSPSYHAVGLMVPGLPIFAIGRNPWIAWGGTNMRAAASDLYDISGLAPEDISERRERIRVRWWFDREVVVRETPFGPILSDAPQLADVRRPEFALWWAGHQESDEISAMLAVARARTFEDFRSAFATFAVPGQNMLYADAAGNIGQVMAVRVPARGREPPPDIVVDRSPEGAAARTMLGVLELPFSFNPEAGVLASANNRPADTASPIGFFFSPDDRVERMAELVGEAGTVAIDDVKRLQQDVYMASSVALRDLFLARLDSLGLGAGAHGREAEVIRLMAEWDGHYRVESRGAVAFELFHHAFTRAFYEYSFGGQDWAAFANVGRIKSLLLEDIERADDAALSRMLRQSLETAAEDIDAHRDWGDMHRLELRHPLAFLPLVGGRFRFGEHPIGGSSDTLMKTAHASARERHTVRYGSNARHISDLSDPDANYFVILGGQDGWINSANFQDQVALWLEGEYLAMPLRLETVRQSFPRRIELRP